MLFNSSNYEDMRRYYLGTFVKFKELGDTMMYIDRINHDSVGGQMDNGDVFKLHLHDDHPYEVDYTIPHKSFFQYKNKACLLQRVPAKQYQRGLSSNNTQIVGLTRTGQNTGVPIDFESLKAYVAKQEFPSFDKGVTVKNGKNVSVVLSPRFAYVPEIKTIYADTIPVAIIDHENRKVKMHTNVFAPELIKLTKDSHFEVQYA